MDRHSNTYTMKPLIRIIMYLIIGIASSTGAYSLEINILSTATTEYQTRPATSIYPAFADGIPYQSWTEKGSKPYYQLIATGGVGPLKWKIIEGALPNGINLTSDGKLQGTASHVGNFAFVVRAIDAKQISSDKALNMVVKPPRSQWLTDAKFGMWFPLGPFATVPASQTKQEIAAFEKGMIKFNAEKWVDAVVARGGKVINVSAKAGDGIRMWPSTTPSIYELKLNRNVIKELIVASHKKGIKLVASFAPDHTWNKKVNDTAPDGTWGTLNKGLIKELIQMGVDGLWIDMGGTPELYPKDVDPKWFPWNEILAMARTINPNLIFANNPGLQHGGTALRYPDTDVLVYEGFPGNSEESLVIAKKSILRKKVAIEVDNLLDSSWSWLPVKNPKSADMIIKNIKANWQVGATYILVVLPSPDGEIDEKAYTPILSEIGKFVRKEQALTRKPVSSLDKEVIHNSPKFIQLSTTPKAKIYYTTDGTAPSTKSKLYTAPVKIDKTTQIKAISVLPGKKASDILDETYLFKPTLTNTSSSKKVLIAKKTPGSVITDSKGYYRGMKIIVGSDPITIDEIGRQHVPNNKNTHAILIKTFTDNTPVLTAELNTNNASVQSDGFQYVSIPPTILKAGVAYIVASKEDDSDQFVSSTFNTKTVSDHFRIAGHFILSPTGDPQPVTDDGIGALLNLKYKINLTNKPKNLALGAMVSFEDNNGNPLPPWMGKYHVENAVDNNLSTRAQAGGQYAWNLKVDFGNIKKSIKTVVIDFPADSYATDFQLLSSNDGINWKVLEERNKNSDLHITLNLPSVQTRFLKVKALKPDGPGQKGSGMGILEFQVY
jgi:hypothetical protein